MVSEASKDVIPFLQFSVNFLWKHISESLQLLSQLDRTLQISKKCLFPSLNDMV